jgi:futalosine hydrolase
MPKVLLIAATAAEIAPTLEHLRITVNSEKGCFLADGDNQDMMTVLTGVGMVNTAFELGKLIGSHFDVVINAGLAGSFVKFRTGDVVNVHQDCFSELGAEDGDRFISIDEMGFGSQNISLHNLFENNYTKNIPKCNGVTVNTVHGNEKSIQHIVEKFQPHVESMEGAAFIQAANAFNWRAIQIRAISNPVERRNRDNWNIGLAVKNLNSVLIELLGTLHNGKAY